MSLVQYLSTSINQTSPNIAALSYYIPRLGIAAIAPFLRLREHQGKIVYPDATTDSWIGYFHDKSIAIVGNGPNIVGRGEEIDSHDIVLRMNFGILPQHLHPEDTGVKTNAVSLGAMQTIGASSIANYLQNSTVERALFCVNFPNIEGRELSDLHLMNRFFICKRFLPNGGINSGLLPSGFYFSIRDELGALSSTGYTTLQFLLQYTAFRSLDIFGFDFSTNNRIVGDMKHAKHNFPREKQLLLNRIDGEKRTIIIHD